MTFQAFRGPTGAQIALMNLLATSIGNDSSILKRCTVHDRRVTNAVTFGQNDKRKKSKVAIKSNFRPKTKISGRLDHSKMHNRLCGKLAASEMFPHLAIFHKPSHTKGLWKIAKPPKNGFSFF